MQAKVLLAILIILCSMVVSEMVSAQKTGGSGDQVEGKVKKPSKEGWELVTGIMKEPYYAARLFDLPYKSILEISKRNWEGLVSQAKAPGTSNEKANIYLWGFLYRLHHWAYINLGGLQSIKPFCGVVNGRPSLMLFTSKEMASAFIKSNKLNDRKEQVSIDAFILPGTLAFIQSFEKQGIEWVCFNMGPDGSFGGPINLLQTGYNGHLKNDSRFKEDQGQTGR